MSDRQTEKMSAASWGFIALMVALCVVAVYFIIMVISDDSPQKKNNVTMVTLLKPPPPQIKEKPPEPEPVRQEQKEEVIAQVPQEAASNDRPAGEPDNAPAGDSLGVDSDGTAGSDAFGLVAKKGGRSLLAGEGGNGLGNLSLLSKYGGYAHFVESEIHKRIMKLWDMEGGLPRGTLQVVVKLKVDTDGDIVEHRIIGSSGNHKMDETVNQVLGNISFSDSPPDGMPRTMKIKMTFKS
ncbi:MAG: TonB family protein [Nitrospiraceae bacterium]|nr:MAG: TonB family protein [Nitrospiraceae bacterium]